MLGDDQVHFSRMSSWNREENIQLQTTKYQAKTIKWKEGKKKHLLHHAAEAWRVTLLIFFFLKLNLTNVGVIVFI